MHIRAVFVIVIAFVIALAAAVIITRLPVSPEKELISTVTYVCNAGKTITAQYYAGEGTPSPSPDQPPTPGGSVSLSLGDGRVMTLPQTISASGIRYANEDESFIFWSKGNGALVLENNEEKSYIGCIAAAPALSGQNLSRIYANSAEGFSIRLPGGYTIDESYRYQGLGRGEDISGIKFAIPTETAAGTNLGSDTYLSVEQIPRVSPPTDTCTAARFLEKASAHTLTESGTTYSVASSTGAAAGNRYEETVYVLPDTNPCVAVRYYLHYGVLENYPPGAVREFGRRELLDQFDAIRRALVVVQ